MVFSSVIFLFLFLPLVLAVSVPLHAGMARRPDSLPWRMAANGWLVVVSLVFYGWGEPRLLPLLLASTAVNYAGGLLIAAAHRRPALVTGMAVAANLGGLLWFKYSYLFSQALSPVLVWLHLPGGEIVGHLPPVALPLGISFFTFHGISYLVDVHRRKCPAARNFVDFACYFTLFPQLVAGPIVRYSEVAADLVARRLSWDGFHEGLRRFIIGLGKKVLIANQVAITADTVFALTGSALNGAAAWIGLTAYALQIYFDFSGYSDMAIGLGRMLGITYPENFDQPYRAASMREFWRRWHMTLTRWFRDYLYIPLGGSRVGRPRTAFNLLLVFALCGLWHGASWNFLLWGLWHGAFMSGERTLGLGLPGRPRASTSVRAMGHAYTLLVVWLGWVVFRCATWPEALHFFNALLDWRTLSAWQAIPWRALAPDVALAFVVGLVSATPLGPWLVRPLLRRRSSDGQIGQTLQAFGLLIVLGLSLIAVGTGSHNPFIYYRF